MIYAMPLTAIARSTSLLKMLNVMTGVLVMMLVVVESVEWEDQVAD